MYSFSLFATAALLLAVLVVAVAAGAKWPKASVSPVPASEVLSRVTPRCHARSPPLAPNVKGQLILHTRRRANRIRDQTQL